MTYRARSVERSAADASSDDRLVNLVRDRELIVVSNRQPYSHEADEEGQVCVDRPTGGLTAGLDPVMQRIGGTWIAWGDGDKDFDVGDHSGNVWVPPDDPGYRLKRLRLSEAAVRDYYYGYSNQVLWPICHSALTCVNGDAEYWRRYSEVNERFADAVANEATDHPFVWFQDYHLSLAPKLAQPRLPDGSIVMQFWHVPWPSWDTFRACAQRREILDGLLGNDLLAFHTRRYRTNFLRCVEAAFDDAVVDWQGGNVSYRGRTTSVEAIPMGVPVEQIERLTTTTSAASFWRSFEQEHDLSGDRRVAIGVDRLDYSKGIVERLKALERLWDVHPEWRGELTYVQNGSESRSRIAAYRDVQQQVSEAIQRINGRFGTDGWQPIVSIDERLSREELYSLFRHADLALVTPIRDGMNLVAQEYVAARGDGDGVLVLSDQAGIHDELGGDAVTICPSDIGGFAEAIVGALTMSPSERRRRMRRLRRWVSTHDLDSWLAANLQAAIESVQTPDSTTSRSVPTT